MVCFLILGVGFKVIRPVVGESFHRWIWWVGVWALVQVGFVYGVFGVGWGANFDLHTSSGIQFRVPHVGSVVL